MNDKIADWMFKQGCKAKFGLDPIHLTLITNLWNFATWKEDDVPYLQNKPGLINNLDRLWKELKETDKNTTVKPLSINVINGCMPPKVVSWQDGIANILPNDGMTEMGKRSTAESTTTNTHHAIGTGTTAAALGDTTLETEIGRKVIGDRVVVNQTERYGTAFTSSDIIPPKTITEAGVLTLAALGVLILHVIGAGQLLDTGLIVTVQTNITHANGTQI